MLRATNCPATIGGSGIWGPLEPSVQAADPPGTVACTEGRADEVLQCPCGSGGGHILERLTIVGGGRVPGWWQM